MAGIFKAYDIRGTYPDQLNDELAYKIGLAFVKVVAADTVVVGRDMRESGIAVADSLIRGITDAGADVIDIGMCATPMLYFAVGHWKSSAGIMVTASHNPAEYNGFKFCKADAVPVAYDTGLNEVEKLVGGAQLESSGQKGSVEEMDIGPDYRAHILKYADGIKPLTVVVDSGNGVMGAFLPALFDKLPVELIKMYFEPDGTFPNHEANPLKPENMQDLIEKVKETGADLGIAFDGDGDRAMYCDENGEIVACDFITALLAAEMLEREPGGTIVYDLRSSNVVKEEIERLGGKPLESRVGHSFIKATMREVDSIFAGELSGHFYFRDIFTTDNAEMAAMQVLGLLSRENKKFSELVAPLRKYRASGEINFEVEDKNAKIQAIKDKYSDAEQYELDGLTTRYNDWWFNVRLSNTEPVLRLNLEADNDSLLQEKLKELTELLES
ncbi:MAG: phosphomannomutase/phosphoglucomutase [Planctomycetota bacterium]|jgi:phosphomannomutase